MTKISNWLSVPDASAAVAFYSAAFGAAELDRLEGDGGTLEVAHLSTDGADFWVQRDPGASPTGEPVRMILSVDDPDAVFAAAIAAGATEINPVAEGHGWRVGRIADPSGHHWEIGRLL
ncbi:MAG: VOC family protein [Acidimicrobiales bacterium]